MSTEKYKVTTVANGTEKHMVWDTSVPMGIDHKLDWVIENTKSGIHLRYLGGRPSLIQPDSFIPVKESSIETNQSIELEKNLLVKIQRLNPIPPAYLSPINPSQTEGNVQQLISFSGIGKALIGSQPIYSAYVAYARGRPIYTFTHNSEGYQIKPLLNGVRLKFKGQPSVLGEIGKPWTLQEDQLLTTTLIRGSNWWRFNWVRTSAVLNDFNVGDTIDDQQNRSLWKTLLLFAALFFISGVVLTLLPRKEKAVEPTPTETPVVQFIQPKKKMILHSPPETIVKPKPKETPKEPVVTPPKEVPKEIPKEKPMAAPKELPKEPVKKPLPEAKKEAAPKKTAEPPKPAATTPPKKATPDKNLAPSNTRSQPAVGAKSQDFKAPKLANPNNTTTAPPPGAKGAEIKKPSQTKYLNDIMGGALSLTKKSVGPTDHVSTKTNSLFSKGDVQVAPTEIRPGSAPDSSKVGTIGGGKGKNAVGYSQGEKVSLGSQPASFVSLETQSLVVEEGLTKDEVGAVIHNHMDEIRYCHESAMLYYPRIEGKLMMQFTIGPQGNVEKAVVQSSTLPEHLLENCIIKKLVRWRFPHPKGGIKVSVGYPFLFKTLERDQ